MRQLSLRQLVVVSWIVLVATGFVFCAAVYLGRAYKDYANAKSDFIENLAGTKERISRRLSAEILLPGRGSEHVVAEQLRKEYGLLSVAAISKSICANGTMCIFENKNRIVAQFPNAFLDDTEYLQIEQGIVPFGEFFKTRDFLLSSLPLMLIFLVGISIQMRIVKLRITGPISELQCFSEAEQLAPTHWPIEIKAIAAKLQESYKRRDADILAQISNGLIHDIQNHLHSVSIATQMAKNADLAPTEKREKIVQNLINTSTSNLQKVTALIAQTLDASRELTVAPQEFDVVEFLQEMVSDFSPVLLKSSVEVSISNPEQPLSANADRAQLGRVVSNVLKNALDAVVDSEPNNRIISISASSKHELLQISIEDSGPGFSKTHNPNLTRIKSTKKHGSGLGLLVSKRIVGAHKGRLDFAKSISLGGAKVSIQIPIVRKQEIKNIGAQHV